VLIEYSDFECPYCAVFTREVLPGLEQAYVKTSRIQIAFRHLPLEGAHRFGLSAAQAAECATPQGKFWEMHDQLFANAPQLDDDSLRRYGAAIGLQSGAFDSCLRRRTYLEKIRAEMRDATALGIGGTPTFLIGQRQTDGRVRIASRFTGAAPFERFKAEIDKLINRVAAGS